jgi:hypothetical protein
MVFRVADLPGAVYSLLDKNAAELPAGCDNNYRAM